MPSQKKKLKISIIGAGNVGTVLAVMLRKRGHTIVSVVSRRMKSARQLIRRVGSSSTASVDPRKISPETTFLLITTPEHAIDEVVQQLARTDLPFKQMFVCHTSGALSSDALSALKMKGAKTFSLHPIQTFPTSISKLPSLERMGGTWYGFEGSRASRVFAQLVVRELNGEFLAVPKEKKILYHLACVFASNYPVVVLGAVQQLAHDVTRGDLTPFRRLFEASAENAFHLGPAKALTGPIVRGSSDVLKRHMLELGAKNPELLSLYSSLGLFGLEILNELRSLKPEQLRQLTSILSGSDDR